MDRSQISKSTIQTSEQDAPIEIFFGNPALDMGIATIPKILPRYWIYLASDGEKLNEREYALLMQVLLLRESQDFELRVSNIPTQCPESTVIRSLALMRRMGLVFTERLYYSPQNGKPPAMRAQRWDLRSLFFNLEQVSKAWQIGQRDLLMKWETSGRQGRKPFFTLPTGFVQEVALPADVAADIVRGIFFPVAERWVGRAQALLAARNPVSNDQSQPGSPTAQDLRDSQPTTQNLRGREAIPSAQDLRDRASTAQNLRDHLLSEEEDEEDEVGTTFRDRIFAHFAQRKGEPDYQPSAKENAALDKLLSDGLTFAQIIAGIDQAFQRSSMPRHFTHCAAITRDLARSQQETRSPETRNQPEARQPEALPGAGEFDENARANASTEVIETSLSRAVDLYKNTGREITSDLLARFRLMAGRCDQAARAYGSTGGEWLAEALMAALGVAKPGNLLNYAEAVLTDWITNGKPEKQARAVQKPRRNKRDEPGVHQGIRDYLEKHGGIPSGDAD